MRVQLSSILGTLAALVALVLPRTSSATFSYTTCPTTYTYVTTPVPTTIGAAPFPAQIDNQSDYGLNVNGQGTVILNPNVYAIQAQLSPYWSSEQNYDYMLLTGSSSVSFTGVQNNTGSPKIIASDLYLPQFSDTAYFTYKWWSDYSINRANFPTMQGLIYECGPGQHSTPLGNSNSLQTNVRRDGVLLATGDTVFFNYTQPTYTDMTIAMDQIAMTANADFDILADPTNSLPDYSAQWRSDYGGSTGEFLFISGSNSSPRQIYIAVHSYAGAGHFSLRASTPVANVGIPFCRLFGTPFTAAQKSNLTDFLKRGAARVFGTTADNFLMSYFYQVTTPCSSLQGLELIRSSGQVDKAHATFLFLIQDSKPFGVS